MEKEMNVVILIAEDDDGHAELIREHLESAGISNPILRFPDGESVWNFLKRPDARHGEAEGHSYLLLLDIRMPKMDGIEVLHNIKTDPQLRSIPVIMLTTTDDPKEVEQCYRYGCNCYITKPIDFNRFAETLRRLGLFIMIVKVAKVENSDGAR